MYIQYKYKAGETIEIQKTYSKRYGKSLKKGKPVNTSPEAVAKYNRKVAIRNAVRTINENFVEGDYHAVLQYGVYNQPSPKQAKKDIAKAIRYLRNALRKQGRELKFMKSTGVGEDGRIHHHLVLNLNLDKRTQKGKEDIALIKQAWPYCNNHDFSRLGSCGDFSALAAYFVGQSKEHPDGEFVILGNRWSCSRNLKRPKPEITHPKAKKWREPPQAIKGYIIDTDSIDMGINPITGMPYQFYRMRRIPEWTMKAAEDNREEVKQAWQRMKTGQPQSSATSKPPGSGQPVTTQAQSGN